MLAIEERTLKTMALDELWDLHRRIQTILADRLREKKNVLEERLRQLHSKTEAGEDSNLPSRRPYPTVIQKFRNPDPPHQTWSGRGKRPRWVGELVDAGISISDLQLDSSQMSAV